MNSLEPDRWERRRTLTVAGFAHFVHDGFTDSAYVLLPLWAQAYGLSHAQVGLLKGCLSGSLASLQVPAGFLAERLGERRVLAMGTAVAGLAYVTIGGFAGGFLGLAGLLLLVGAGCSTQHPLGASIVSQAFHHDGRRAALGTYNFSGDLGKMAVPVTFAAAAAAIGWQSSSIALGLFGIAASGAVAVLLGRTRVPESSSAPETVALAGGSLGVRDVRGFAVLSGIGGIDGAVRGGFMTFMPFLLMDKGAPTESIGIALALVFGGGAVGKLVCGLLAERVGILRTVVLTELATGLAIFACVALPLSAVFALLPLLGVALNGTSSVLYATVGDLVDPERQSRAFGLFYTVGIGSAALAPFLCGLLSDAFGVDYALRVLSACIFTTLPLCVALAPSLYPHRGSTIATRGSDVKPRRTGL